MITAVEGTCDNQPLHFEKIRGKWKALVPADLNDGMYAVEIYAVTHSGAISYYIGFLYMNDGIASIELEPDGMHVEITDSRHYVSVASDWIVEVTSWV